MSLGLAGVWYAQTLTSPCREGYPDMGTTRTPDVCNVCITLNHSTEESVQCFFKIMALPRLVAQTY